jgi:hypothetical protein
MLGGHWIDSKNEEYKFHHELINETQIKLQAGHPIKEINNYNTQNNITIHGNNSGIASTKKHKLRTIGNANPAKSGSKIRSLKNILSKVLGLAPLFLPLLKKIVQQPVKALNNPESSVLFHQ